MSQIVQYDESLPINFNLVKEGFVDALVSEKFLTPEQGDIIKKKLLCNASEKKLVGKNG